MLWILAGIAGAWTFEHVALPLTAFLFRSFRSTQRLWHFPRSDRSPLLAALASDERVFFSSQDVYENGPEEMLDDFTELFEWLREDQYTPPAVEEIYLVARKRFRPGAIRAVLYASLYREFTPTRTPNSHQPACFVSTVSVHDELRPDRQAVVAQRLWKRLHREVRKHGQGARCDFFFQLPIDDEDASDGAPSFYSVFLSDVARAQKVGLAPIPDFDPSGTVEPSDALLLHSSLSSRRRALPASDVAEFVYGVLWLFTWRYQGQVHGRALPNMQARAQVLAQLSEEFKAQANAAGELVLEPFEPRREDRLLAT